MAASTTLPADSTAGEKLDFKKILPIFVIVLIDLLGLTIIIPLLPFYATSFGADAFMIGLLGAAYPVMQFVGAPILGRLSDRYGRKPVLLISQLGTILGFLMMGFAGSLAVLFVARLIDGLSGANISTAQAAIADSTTEKTRTQGLGLIGAAFGLGFTVGPVLAFVVLAVTGNNYHVVAFVAAAFSALSFSLTWFWFKETLPPERRGAGAAKAAVSIGSMLSALRHPLVGFLLTAMFVQQLAFGGFQQLLSLFTLNRLGFDASGNALLFVVVGIVVVVIQGGLIGRWSRKYGDRWLILLGLSFLSAGLILTAVTPNQAAPWYSKEAMTMQLAGVGGRTLPGETPPTQNLQILPPEDANRGWLGIAWAVASMIVAAIGGAVLSPAINSSITRQVSPQEMGGMLGISAAFVSAANALAPVIGGAIFQALGSTAPFLIGGLLLAVLWFFARTRIKPAVGRQ
jgi:DHA1 family tetracycline resistance protein-like MFS transporter